jgi:hypothetical protein
VRWIKETFLPYLYNQAEKLCSQLTHLTPEDLPFLSLKKINRKIVLNAQKAIGVYVIFNYMRPQVMMSIRNQITADYIRALKNVHLHHACLPKIKDLDLQKYANEMTIRWEQREKELAQLFKFDKRKFNFNFSQKDVNDLIQFLQNGFDCFETKMKEAKCEVPLG